MGEVWRREVSGTEQQVLLVLCDHANDDGANCYPSVPLIAWKIGVSDRTVRRIIKELEQRGAISIGRQDGKANQYRIHLDALEAKQPLTKLCHPRRNVTPDIAMSGHPGHNSVTPTPDIAMSPEPSVEPSITTNQASNVVHIAAPPPKPTKAELMERFERWYQHYPKKRNRGQAEKTWLKMAPSEDMTAQMIEAVTVAAKSPGWVKDNGQFIPNPSTWLNAKGWLDDICAVPSGPPGVELLPGEVATEIAPGHWELDLNGVKRIIRPDYYGVIFDPRKHMWDGYKDFVRDRTEAERRAHNQIGRAHV